MLHSRTQASFALKSNKNVSKTFAEKVATLLMLAFIALPNHSRALEGRCFGIFKSSNRATEFETQLKKVEKKYPNNERIKELRKELQGKAAEAQARILINYFTLSPEMDLDEFEKAIENKLNDGSRDKVSGEDVGKLSDVLTGNR